MATLQKLLKIQAELKAPKNQYNSFGDFHYRSCEDILSAAKPLCAREGVLLTLSDEVVLMGDRYYVKATAKITDGEDAIQVEAFARETESRPKMDAAQLTGSASSYSRKYALNGLFCLDDTKDADALKPVEDKPKAKKPVSKSSEKDANLREVAKVAKEQHLDGNDVKAIMQRKYKKDTSTALTDKEAADLAKNFLEYAIEYINDEALMEGV